jgi:hypothetical protein
MTVTDGIEPQHGSESLRVNEAAMMLNVSQRTMADDCRRAIDRCAVSSLHPAVTVTGFGVQQ